MKIGLLFAGQGSQHVGMGKDLYLNNSIFKETLDMLDVSNTLIEKMFNGPIDELTKTSIAQPCIVAFGVSVSSILKYHNIEPNYVAGLSLGEYTALNFSDVLTNSQVLDIVSYRGEAMEEASKNVDSAMAAIIGFEREKLQEIINAENGIVTIANYNYPGQQVIAGEKKLVESVSKKAIEQGAKRSLPLNVSGPFHTKYMESASLKLKTRFQNETFKEQNVPVIFNVTGKEEKDDNVKNLLVEQVKSSVYFEDSIKYMIEKGVDTFIEVGPGKTLSSFVKKISSDVKVLQIFDLASLEATLNYLEEKR